MKNKYYTPKWRVYQNSVKREAIKNNANLRRFMRIRMSIFAFNIAASAVLLTIIFVGVL